MSFTDFRGAAKRLADIDLTRLGAEIGVGEDEIHAFLDTETTGSGFDDQGRPKILFEPAVFYRNLSGAKQLAAVSQGLAAKTWGEIPYGKSSEQYPKLQRALIIDETAALKACSWGIGQVLGENYAAAGYHSVHDMVTDAMEGEEPQLQQSINFIKANHLDDELRKHQWAAFARGYNGAGYAKNQYDTKLAAAFAKWQKIPDTKWVPGTGLVDAATGNPPPPVAVNDPVPLPVDAVPPTPASEPQAAPPAPVALPSSSTSSPQPQGFWLRFLTALFAALFKRKPS